MNELLKLAISESKAHPDLAQSYSEIAFKIGTRFNIRLKERRKLICRGCGSLMVPPTGARYRLSKKRQGMNITCLKCGNVYRILFGSHRGT